MPSISILMPSYMHAEYIEHAIDSVLSQSYQDYELIISDDASTDKTSNILNRFSNHPNVKIYFQPVRLGAVQQISFLLQKAKGNYIALLNSDDMWLPEKLQIQMVYMQQNPSCEVTFTVADMVDKNGIKITKQDNPLSDIFYQKNRTRAEWMQTFFKQGNCICHPSILIKRSLYEAFPLNPALRQLPDYDVWTRMFQVTQPYIIPDSLVLHRRIELTNTSAETESNTIRLMREQAWIQYHMISEMSESLFQEAFHEDFVFAHPNSSAQLNCERFFLLKKQCATNAFLIPFALAYYMDYIREEEFSRTMIEKYGYGNDDFYVFSSLQDKGTPFSVKRGFINNTLSKIASHIIR